MYDIARRNNIMVDDLLKINGLNKDDYIYPGQQILIPKDDFSIYVTNNGDTIETLLNNFKTTPDKLIMQNKNILVLPDQLVIYKDRMN